MKSVSECLSFIDSMILEIYLLWSLFMIKKTIVSSEYVYINPKLDKIKDIIQNTRQQHDHK